jgi:hypothetical protein
LLEICFVELKSGFEIDFEVGTEKREKMLKTFACLKT